MENPFEENALDYDKWYDENEFVFESELAAILYLFKKAKRKIKAIPIENAKSNLESSHIIYVKDNLKSNQEESEKSNLKPNQFVENRNNLSLMQRGDYLNMSENKNENLMDGLEIGVGSGRFATALGIETGIDPSLSMIKIAADRGINSFEGVAESLPFDDSLFDYTTFFTSICFIENPLKAFQESFRVTRKGGFILVSFLDRSSNMGKYLSEHKQNDKYYKSATFYNGQEIISLLKIAGYDFFTSRQTIFNMDISEFQKNRHGLGEGIYGVILGWKK